MKVLVIGGGIRYFTIPIANFLDSNGHIIGGCFQKRMLKALKRKVKRARLSNKIDLRLCTGDSLNLEELLEGIDFVLAFEVIRELSDQELFFIKNNRILTLGGLLLLVEPKRKIEEDEFNETVNLAQRYGFYIVERPEIRKSNAVLLRKMTRLKTNLQNNNLSSPCHCIVKGWFSAYWISRTLKRKCKR